MNKIITICLLLLTGCAGEYTFNSNLNSEAIDDYFKAGDVTVYSNQTPPPHQFIALGTVEAEVCQEIESAPPISVSDARTKLRRVTADKGGDGVIIHRCSLFESSEQGCFSRAFCVGEAIKATNTRGTSVTDTDKISSDTVN